MCDARVYKPLAITLVALLCSGAGAAADESAEQATGAEAAGTLAAPSAGAAVGPPAGPYVLDPTVVTATVVPQPQATLGNSVTVLSAEELEAQGVTELADALETSAGVSLGQSGGDGTFSSLFLRGGESDHTLVLVDGVPVNDVGGGFNLSALNVSNVERVEVIRGAQSALFGAEAMSGVINIITKKGEGPRTWTFDVGGGSRDILRTSTGVSGSTDVAHYSLSIARHHTGNRDGLGNDGFTHATASGRGGFALGDDIEVDATFRIDWRDLETAFDAGLMPVDTDSTDERRDAVGSVAVTHHITDIWDHRLSLGLYEQESDAEDVNAQSINDGAFVADSTINRVVVDYRHTVTLLDTHAVTLGGEYEDEESENNFMSMFFSARTRRRLITRAVYAQVQARFLDETLNLQAGVRVDDNSIYGTEVSPRVAASYLVRRTQTRIHGSYGEGIKNPNIFELASNPNLEPEESAHWDVGVEQRLFDDRVALDVTYFEQDIQDRVDFVLTGLFTSTAFNVGKAETQGIEVTATVQLLDTLSGRMAYTFLQTEDTTTNDDLPRRPKHAGSVSVTYHPERWYLTASVRAEADSPDVNFPPPTFARTRVMNDAYARVNLSGGYEVNEHIELYGILENLLDDEYETAFGFPQNGITVLAGVRGTF